MTIEERLENLERELTATKKINRWKLAVVALSASLLCIGIGRYPDSQSISLVPSAYAQGVSHAGRTYFVTTDGIGVTCSWELGTGGKLILRDYTAANRISPSRKSDPKPVPVRYQYEVQ